MIRGYREQKETYWQSEIKEKQSRKRKCVEDEIFEASENYKKLTGDMKIDIEELAIGELKANTIEAGIVTRVRNRDKLINILKTALNSN